LDFTVVGVFCICPYRSVGIGSSQIFDSRFGLCDVAWWGNDVIASSQSRKERGT
jgi:hypothetical protein